MSHSEIERVHKELGYTEDEARALKDVRLVWQRLDKLQKQATRDTKHLAQYRDLLQQSLVQLRASLPDEDADAIGERCRQLWNWYQTQCERLKIPEIEARRGKGHQAWMAKALPKEYKLFTDAVAAMVECPSPKRIEEVKAAATLFLQAYVAAI